MLLPVLLLLLLLPKPSYAVESEVVFVFPCFPFLPASALLRARVRRESLSIHTTGRTTYPNNPLFSTMSQLLWQITRNRSAFLVKQKSNHSVFSKDPSNVTSENRCVCERVCARLYVWSTCWCVCLCVFVSYACVPLLVGVCTCRTHPPRRGRKPAR